MDNYPLHLEPLSLAQYGVGNTLDLVRRWQTYEHAVPYRNLYTEMTDVLQLTGSETLIDVGCSDGSYLRSLRGQGHGGRLIGVDIHPDIFLVPQQDIANGELATIDFLVADAQCLPLADDSVDVVSALFMVYHIPQAREAFHEFQRILRPAGHLAIATSGDNNKSKHRELEQIIADVLGSDSPPRFNSKFTSWQAEQLLKSVAMNIVRISQTSEMRFTLDTVDDYYDSLRSMKSAFQPVPRSSEVEAAIQEHIVPIVEREVTEQGYFCDTIERDVFVGEINKTSRLDA